MTLPNEDIDVGVSFYGPDFFLSLLRTRSAETDDETRAHAAAEWFSHTYGFDPGEHATNITVTPVSFCGRPDVKAQT